MKQEIKIELLEEAADFLRRLNTKERDKFSYIIRAIMNGYKDSEKFKKLTADIWEFRAKSNGNIYRLFAFWDKEQRAFIVCTHGFQKKTQKTPQKEIKRAEAIMKEYYKNR